MATKYDQSSATRPVSICSHTSAFQVHFKHTSSALEMSSVNPPIDADVGPEDIDIVHRFKKGKRQPNPIIVRFNNYYSKKEMYYGRRKLRKVNVRHISGAEKDLHK